MGRLVTEIKRQPELEIHSWLPFPLLEFKIHGQKIVCATLGAPGAPFAGAVVDVLCELGLKKIVLVGSTGVLESHIKRGAIILPTEAVRDEGTSYHYLAPGEAARPSNVLLDQLRASCLEHGITPREGKTWTTDAFFRETYEKIEQFRNEGAICVEMEAAACFAVAQYRNIELATLLIASDSIAGTKWETRGSNSEIENYNKAQQAALRIAVNTLTSQVKSKIQDNLDRITG
jgi:uridine phosphorylase